MLIGLMVVALGATDTITYTSLRSYLFQQLDNTLSSISAVPNGVVLNALYNSQNNSANNELGLPNGTFAAIYDTDANGVLAEQLPATAGWTGGVPVVPVGGLERSLTTEGESRKLTTAGTSGTHFRLFAEAVVVKPGGVGAVPFNGIFVVAIPLNGVTGTAHRLLVLELLVTLAVLIALVLAAWLTVRIGLRPLEEITETAGAIAAGDLTQRVKQTDDKTEVGRLGSALNVMLGRIETAFRERETSEARLRRFVADASHELRTPLTSIRGYAELFQHGLVDRPADLDTAMRRIDSESVRMAGLVDDLLLLARLDQGRPLEREAVDLTVLVADAAQDARAVDPSRSVTVDAPSSCFVDGDDGRLRQLLGNLVSNALAYTPADSPIEITAALEPSNGDAKARICVVDHGPGIPAEAVSHVFERFWRLDPARVHSQGGAGLGLSIVAAVAQAHGGDVSISETPGGGATFSVELPVEPEPESPPWGAKETDD
ncbi:MAG: HAMP domain-containing sensor histidine kinase [Acidimicrobiales bacterium]|jgi:two-component system OmpR family sensor kinase